MDDSSLVSCKIFLFVNCSMKLVLISKSYVKNQETLFLICESMIGLWGAVCNKTHGANYSEDNREDIYRRGQGWLCWGQGRGVYLWKKYMCPLSDSNPSFCWALGSTFPHSFGVLSFVTLPVSLFFIGSSISAHSPAQICLHLRTLLLHVDRRLH